MNGFAAQTLAACLASLTMLSGGMTFGWPAPSLPKLLASDSDLLLTPDQSSWVASLNNIGAIFGPLIVVLVVDRIGRKWTLYLTVMPMLVCWLLIGFAKNYLWLYAGRFIGGLGVGSVYAALPIYLGEISDDRIRGGLGVLTTTMMNIGMMVSFSTGPWVSRQILALISSVPPVIFIFTFFWMPETPYYYLVKSNRDAANSSLLWLRRRDEVNEELTHMEESVRSQQQNNADVFRLVTKLGNRRAFIAMIGLLTFQQLSGIPAIQSYATTIFEESGSSLSSNVSTIVMGIVKSVAAICVVFVVDITGRRPILLSSAVCSAFSIMALGVFFHLKEIGHDVSAVSWTPLVLILCLYLTYTAGFGALPYAIIGEIFATDVKALATTVLSMYGSVGGSFVTKLYQVFADAFGMYTVFYGFSVCLLSSTVFIYFYIPETKGRSLQKIQDELNKHRDSTDDILKNLY